MCLVKSYQGPNYGSQIILSECAADINYPAVRSPFTQPLFEKIRKVDSSVAERATRMEAAILKRLSE